MVVWKSRRTDKVASYWGANALMISGIDVQGASPLGSLMSLGGASIEYAVSCLTR